VSSCADKLRTGYEMRQTDCLITLDHDNARVRITRMDTDEVIEDREMSEEERQMDLFAGGANEEEGGEETGPEIVTINVYCKPEGADDAKSTLQGQFIVTEGGSAECRDRSIEYNGDPDEFGRAVVEANNAADKEISKHAQPVVFVRADVFEDGEAEEGEQEKYQGQDVGKKVEPLRDPEANYRLAKDGDIPCAQCLHVNFREESGRPECTFPDEPHHYAVGKKRTCDHAEAEPK